MSEVQWCDPPTPRGGALNRREQRELAEQLRGRPGDWAVFPTHGSYVAARALASRISRGRQSAFREGFEAMCRDGVVYVRYVGG